MEEVAKTRYLTGKGSEQKLKRNVPKRLRHIASKTAWIERVAGLSARDINRRAALFAVNTDTDIGIWERELAAAKDRCSSGDQAIPNKLSLNDIELQQLAIWYFNKENISRRSEMPYQRVDDDTDDFDIMMDAGADIKQAEQRLSKGRIYNAPIGLDVLEAGKVFANIPKKGARRERKKWVSSLIQCPKFRLFCVLLERAELELSNQRLRSLTERAYTYDPDPLFSGASVGSGNTFIGSHEQWKQQDDRKEVTIGELSDRFLASQKELVGRSRFDQYKIPIRVLAECFGQDIPLSQVTKEKLEPVLEFLPTIPSWVSRHYKRKSLEEAADIYKEKHGRTAQRYNEAKKILQVLDQVFRFAVGKGWVNASPTTGLSIKVPVAHRPKMHEKKEATYQPYTNDELDKIFSSFVYSGKVGRGYFSSGKYQKSKQGQIIRDQMYWAPLLALWTGMRMNEILQLERADLKQTNEGVWYLSVTDKVEMEYADDQFGKRVKNVNAVRDVPLHPFINEIGFVKWATKVSRGRLFPDAHRGEANKPSDLFSKNYNNHGKKIGVWEHRHKVFHSFRNNFNDALRHAGVSVEYREAINGWQQQHLMDKKYGQGEKIERLYAEVAKVGYDGVDWSLGSGLIN